jgi:hypothetical protein
MPKAKKVITKIIPVVDPCVGQDYARQQVTNQLVRNAVADFMELWNPWKFLK